TPGIREQPGKRAGRCCNSSGIDAMEFTFGIEEEYFLVDAATKLLACDVPQAFFEAARAATDDRIAPEFLQPQVEAISSPHMSMADARGELRQLRRPLRSARAAG